MEFNSKMMVGGALGVIALAVITLIGMAIVTTVGYSDTYKTPTAVVNESFTGNSAAYVTLAHDELLSTGDSVINTSGTAKTNYTLNRENGSIRVGTDLNGLSLKISYTYYADSDVTDLTTALIAGVTVFAAFCSLIVLVLVGKILIGLIRSGME